LPFPHRRNAVSYGNVCDNTGRIINPHNYCKPIAKSPSDVRAIVNAMVSGDSRFFFGSDNAPHPASAKRKIPPAAGIFNPFALPMLCAIFEKRQYLDRLENFVSRFGADFYGLPRNEEAIELVKKNWAVPAKIEGIVPFMAGQTLYWQVVD